MEVGSCHAAEPFAVLWQKANAYYQQKQYDSAAACYEQIAAAQPNNEDVYYNLGNAYYRLNKVPQAILNYNRALAINPDDKLAADNLKLAQSRIGNVIQPEPEIFFLGWWHSVTRPDRANGLAIIALVLFILVILIRLTNKFRKNKPMPGAVAGWLFFIFICFLSLAVMSAHNAMTHDRGVVMEADVPLMNNQLSGKPIMLVPEGTLIKIREQKGEWTRVSLPDGHTGWIQQSTINKI
jgi:hypothetical protein